MRPRAIGRLGAVIAVAVACLLAAAVPASATVHPYKAVMNRGLIRVAGVGFPVPSDPPAACPGTTSISGTIDDLGTTDNMTGNLNITSGNFSNAALGAGDFQLLATGSTGTGANRGNYNAGLNPDEFDSLHFPSISFTIRRIDTSTCTPGVVECAGTATVTLEGEGVTTADTPPFPTPPSTPDQFWVRSTAGQIISMSDPCPFPASLVIRAGATVEILANPANPGDSGALFDVTDS